MSKVANYGLIILTKEREKFFLEASSIGMSYLEIYFCFIIILISSVFLFFDGKILAFYIKRIEIMSTLLFFKPPT